MIKPTISNAFTLNAHTTNAQSSRSRRNRIRGEDTSSADRAPTDGSLLCSMKADLRGADFGFSLELSPIQAVDAVHALLQVCPQSAQLLVSVEQSAWRDGNADARLPSIAARLGIEPLDAFGEDHLALDAASLATLVAIAQPVRLLAIAVDGPIEQGDVQAIEAAIGASRSPLTAELRAVAALEVLGDRSVVMHARDRHVALNMIAQNFRHYLAALLDRPAEGYAAPPTELMGWILDATGSLSVRPIETTIATGSIDVGFSTALEGFARPAERSLIFDRPSNSWHAE